MVVHVRSFDNPANSLPNEGNHRCVYSVLRLLLQQIAAVVDWPEMGNTAPTPTVPAVLRPAQVYLDIYE